MQRTRNGLTADPALGASWWYNPADREKQFAYTPEQQAFIDLIHGKPANEVTPDELERYRLLMKGFWQPDYPKW